MRNFAVGAVACLCGTYALIGVGTASAVPASTTLFSSTTPGVATAAPVPGGICSVTITADGGMGGSNPAPSAALGGAGASVTARIAMSPGDTLNVLVGGVGGNAVAGVGGDGGIGGGGGANGGASGGGGASAVWTSGQQPLVVAGAGGGANGGHVGGAGGLLGQPGGNGTNNSTGGTAGKGGKANGVGGDGGTGGLDAGGGAGGGVGTGGTGGDPANHLTKGGNGGTGDGTVGGGGGSGGGDPGNSGVAGGSPAGAGTGGVGPSGDGGDGGAGVAPGGDGGDAVHATTGSGGAGGVGFGGGGGGGYGPSGSAGGGGAGYGAGGGAAGDSGGSGGGGSSFVAAGALSQSSAVSARTGNGQVTITYDPVADACPDTTDPSVTVTTPPEGAVYSQGQMVTADFECSDSGGSGLASCVGTVADGSAVDTSTLGGHSFTVTGTDGTGNSAAVTHAYTVVAPPDTTPPQTTIGKGPDKKTSSTSATFQFSSSEAGSTFSCTVDKKAATPCASPFKVKKLEPGKHAFSVVATDAAGNADPSPATFSWKVKKEHKRHH